MSAWKIRKEASIYFVTFSITGWYPVFTDILYFDIIIESLRYCRDKKGLHIYAYVLMLNHVHLIVSVKEGPGTLSDVIRDMKRHTSKAISVQLKRDGKVLPLRIFSQAADKSNQYQVWQQGFHPKGIVSEKFCLQKLNYIHDNPVRKGYVRRPEHWYYSSAGNYAGLTNLALEIESIFDF